MGSKENYCKVLEDILGNKLGGTKYKEFGANLGPAVADYLKEELTKNKVTGPYLVMGSNLARKISKLTGHEAILACITESLMTNSSHVIN